MADNTGAPFFLPYPENTDLVRNGASDIEALADATATALAAAGANDASDLTTGTLAKARMAAGTILNVVQVVKTNTFTTASGNYTQVTGLSAAITPTSASSKVLVIAYYTIQNTDSARGAASRLVRGANPIFIADAAGFRVTGSYVTAGDNLARVQQAATVVFLDSPATTSSTTYGVQVAVGLGGTVTIGRSGFDDGDNGDTGRSPSSITLIEVAA